MMKLRAVLLLVFGPWLICNAQIQSVKSGFVFPNGVPMGVNSVLNRSTSYVALNVASDKVGWVFQVPKTGDIRKWCFATYTVNTGATMDVRAETVSTSTGYPSGTLWGTTTNGAQVILDSDDNAGFCTQFTADASVTRGQYIGMVVANPGTSYGNMVIPVFGDDLIEVPYMCKHDGAAWVTKYQYGALGAAEYSDGSYEPVWGMLPIKAVNTVSFNSGSATKVRGLRFKLPFPATITGVTFNVDMSGLGDFIAEFYDSDATTVLTSATFDADLTVRSTSASSLQLIFDAAVNLVKDVWYRVAIKPTSVTNIKLADFDVQTAAMMDAASGGQNFHYTSSAVTAPTGEADWSNTTTKRPFLYLLFRGFDAGTGGSCGTTACVSP